MSTTPRITLAEGAIDRPEYPCSLDARNERGDLVAFAWFAHGDYVHVGRGWHIGGLADQVAAECALADVLAGLSALGGFMRGAL